MSSLKQMSTIPGGTPSKTAASHTAAQDKGERAAEAFSQRVLTSSFWADYWEKKPLHIAKALLMNEPDDATFIDFAGWLSVDDVLAATALAVIGLPHALKIYKEGLPFRLNGVLSLTNTLPLYHAYLDGASFIINQADRLSRPLQALCRALARQHFIHCFGVLYLTPPRSYAVRPHSDDQDVFLLQIWGTKKWRVYAPPSPPGALPYSDEMIGKEREYNAELGEPVMEATLHAGDILYLPRGHVHEAHTAGEASLHVTITVQTSDYGWGPWVERRVQEILRKELPESLSHAARRARLVPKPTSEEGGMMSTVADEGTREAFDDLLTQIVAKIDLNSAQRSFLDHLEEMNRIQEEQYTRLMKQADKLRLDREISTDSVVQLSPDIISECTVGSDIARFRRGQDVLQLKICASASRLINQLADHKPHVVKDLPCGDAFERVCVCRVLLAKEVLQLCRSILK